MMARGGGGHPGIDMSTGRISGTPDPDAKLGRDPVAFLLAMAPDAAQVGMLTDNWIIGDTL